MVPGQIAYPKLCHGGKRSGWSTAGQCYASRRRTAVIDTTTMVVDRVHVTRSGRQLASKVDSSAVSGLKKARFSRENRCSSFGTKHALERVGGFREEGVLPVFQQGTFLQQQRLITRQVNDRFRNVKGRGFWSLRGGGEQREPPGSTIVDPGGLVFRPGLRSSGRAARTAGFRRACSNAFPRAYQFGSVRQILFRCRRPLWL